MSLPSMNTDQLMRGCYDALKKDLAGFAREEVIKLETLEEIRTYEYNFKYAHPQSVRANSQLLGWLKRYRFESDLYTDEQLEERTNTKFLAEQLRIGTYIPLTFRARKVLQLARKKIKQVLGDWPGWHELNQHCRFSRNSVVGFSGEEVYLDEKINPESELTGTAAELDVFILEILQRDQLLLDCIKKVGDNSPVSYTLAVNSLKQVNVPKTAVISRPVRPNTLVGSFLSYGIGKYIVGRISSICDIDLNYLQPIHKELARKGSFRMNNATGDLTSASDNFTSWLMNMLLPRLWYTELNKLRTPYVSLAGSVIWSPSFMAMGIGYTFPLMTLMFQCLLESLQELSGITGRISVFGDDLIYPRRLHPYVVTMFNDLNFRLNPDKTFHDIPFRESCGGDYYEGVDVRPARPEGVSELLKGEVSICAYVYKLFNSLILRWEEVELPHTFGYLRQVVRNLGSEPMHVPDHFPDSSGYKDGNWRKYAVKEVPSTNRRKPFYNGLVVRCLIERGRMRPVGNMSIFLYEKLKGIVDDECLLPVGWKRGSMAFHPDGSVNKNFTPPDTDVLVWKREKSNRRVFSKTHRRTYRKMHAFTTKRGMRYVEISSQVVS